MLKNKKKVKMVSLIMTLILLGVGTEYIHAATVKYVQMDSRPQDIAGINAIKEAFETENPNIKIQIGYYSWDEAVSKLTTEILAGNPPDCSQLALGWRAGFYAMGGLQVLDNWVRDYPWKDQYYGPAKRESIIDNHWVGLPWFIGVFGLFYNKEMFKEAGLSDVDVPETWEDVYNLRHKLTIDKNGDGFYDQFTWIWSGADDAATKQVYVRAKQFGGSLFDEKGNVAINSEPWVKALKMMKQSITLDPPVSPPETPTIDYALRDRGFAEGYAAMYSSSNWVNYEASQRKTPEGELIIGATAYPYLKECGPKSRKALVDGNDIVMYKDAKDKDATWKWISFMSSPKGQRIWVEHTMFTPSSKIIGEEDIVQSNPYISFAVNTVETAFAPPNIPGWGTFLYDVGRVAIQRMLLGHITPEEAAKEMHKGLESLLEKEKK